MQDPDLKISDFINADCIFLNVDLPGKEAVLRFLADKGREMGLVSDADLLFRGFMEREQLMSTGVGSGLAFPHTVTGERSEAAVLIVRLSKPVFFDSMDDRDVDLVLAVLIPESNQTQHLQILARVSRLCRKSEFLSKIRRGKDPVTVKKDIREIEEEFNGFVYQA